MMNRKPILIIDDNEDDCLMISRIIRDEFQTSYSDGSDNIISLVEELKPECLLLDYHLKLFKGIEILKTIKSDKSTLIIPVMMLTSEKDPEVVVECMKNGADDYLIKGKIDKERLLASIKILIEKSKLQQHVNKLESLLPICMHCKKIRKPDTDYTIEKSWEDIEVYIANRTSSEFSHSICPECYKKFYENID